MWKPEQVLPSEISLAEELGVSIGTLRKAFDRLETERLLIRRQGRGTFVTNRASEEMLMRFTRIRDSAGRPLRNEAQPLEQSQGPADVLEQERLRLTAEDTVLRTRRLRCHTGRPLTYEESRLALARFPGMDEGRVPHDYRITALAQRYGLHLEHACERVSLAEATGEVAHLLSVESGKGLLRLDRVIYATHDQPIEWRIALCNLGEHSYFADMR
ncbi:MAG: GntR family transcriptional regulator [Hyphomicrobium sp.]|uniref:GntR family transcriptional regulator n=1 Tax=Hyphomicrobium sp. TaxID=82 RepID=UPI0025C16965|nr:GntR family transcriptional regulator [Hyphomicrobium sp.]MBZ0210515.1 GntR family transcriptional regulator [Hyphomicrobium sp.]